MRTHLCLISVLAVSVLACQAPSSETGRQTVRGFALPAGDAERGRQAFEDLRCYTCHQVAGLEGELPRPTADPQVDVTLGGLAMRSPTDGELFTSIVHPSHQIVHAAEPERVTSGTGSRMANLNETMTVQQLIDLVAFLHERYQTAR